jgi:uncharacterized membrane protein YccC
MRSLAADPLTISGWSTRARLIAADLVAFDPHRLGWVMALRTTGGLALPLLLAQALGQPGLVWIGLGAYLLAIGDCIDDRDRGQPIRITVGTILGGLALATGVLAGATLPTALAGMMVWGFLSGMMGVYGNAFAAMALPVAWAYVELGLPASDHTLENAVISGGLFMLGGVLTLLLTLTLRFGGTFAPVRTQTAICFRELVRYLESAHGESLRPPEPRVRSAIAEARRLAAQARQTGGGPSRLDQRIPILIEMADGLYSLIGAMRETGQQPIFACKEALLAIAGAVDGRAQPAELARLRLALEECLATTEREPALPVSSDMLGRRLVEALGAALSQPALDEPPLAPGTPETAGSRFLAVLSPVLANLDLNSVVARHALRFAVVTSLAVLVFWVFPKPFGYWVPLTVTVVLKPYAGMTLARAVQRAAGTALGILAGLALTPLLPAVSLQFGAAISLFFAMMAVLPFNYALAIVFLSAGVIPFEHVLMPDVGVAIGTERLVATAIGTVLALIGGHVLWPTFERRGLPDLLRASVEAMAAYADSVIGTAQGDVAAGDMQMGRRRAGLALTNLQVGVQRSLTEVGSNADAMTAILRASAALQHLSNTLNMLLHMAPIFATSRPALRSFRADFVSALSAPHKVEPPISSLRADIPADNGSPAIAMLSRNLDRLVSALEMLRHASSPATSQAAMI